MLLLVESPSCRSAVRRTNARRATRRCISLISCRPTGSRTTRPASSAATAKELFPCVSAMFFFLFFFFFAVLYTFDCDILDSSNNCERIVSYFYSCFISRCAATLQWMVSSTASPTLSSFSRKQAPSLRNFQQVNFIKFKLFSDFFFFNLSNLKSLCLQIGSLIQVESLLTSKMNWYIQPSICHTFLTSFDILFP